MYNSAIKVRVLLSGYAGHELGRIAPAGHSVKLAIRLRKRGCDENDGVRMRLKKLEEGRANEEIARSIRGLRMKARLTQAQLAELVGTTASVICRLEDAEYEGHSLVMLRRIADSLNQRVEIRFVPIRRSA
jgi:DNA-binding XRE family transcriptional regulator